MHPLEEHRKSSKLTMAQMAEKIGCGVSVYKSWIYGWRYPSAHNLRKIEDTVAIDPMQLWKAYKELEKVAGDAA